MDTNDKNGNVDDSTIPHGLLSLGHNFCIHDVIAMAMNEQGYEMDEQEAIDFMEFDGDRIAELAKPILVGLLIGAVNEYIRDMEDLDEENAQPTPGPQLVSKLVQ